MKKLYITLLLCGASLMATAQGTFDVLKMSETQLNGTSRYMSMAGAFGALGGDVSAISQNPGGIGVYRKSDISVTMNLNFLSSKTPGGDKLTNTKFWFNNVGYVGSMKIDSDFFKSQSNSKTIKERLLGRLTGACITGLLGVVFLAVAIYAGRKLDWSSNDDVIIILYLLGGILLAVGLALLVVYFIGRKMLEKEIEAEEKQILERR